MEQQHTAHPTTCNNLVCFKHKGVTEYLEIMSSNEKTKHKKLQVLSRDEAAVNTPGQSLHSSSSNRNHFNNTGWFTVRFAVILILFVSHVAVQNNNHRPNSECNQHSIIKPFSHSAQLSFQNQGYLYPDSPAFLTDISFF